MANTFRGSAYRSNIYTKLAEAGQLQPTVLNSSLALQSRKRFDNILTGLTQKSSQPVSSEDLIQKQEPEEVKRETFLLPHVAQAAPEVVYRTVQAASRAPPSHQASIVIVIMIVLIVLLTVAIMKVFELQRDVEQMYWNSLRDSRS